MASHGFWSLGGDNARADTGSQSPSTREWLFCLQTSSDAGAALIPAHCLNPARCVWCYSRRVKIQTGLLCLYSTHLLLRLFFFFFFLQGARIWSKGLFYYNLHGASVLKLDRTWSPFIHYLIYPPSLPARAWCQAAAQKFSGGIGSKLYGMLAEGVCGTKGGGWGRYFGDMSFYF